MAVVKKSNYAIGDASLNDLMTSTDKQRKGYHQVSLTEMTTTTVPAVAAGSEFEDNTGLYEVTTETAISGSPTGKTWIVFNPVTLLFSFTNTVPTWANDKQGWYGTGGSENNRYLLFIMTVAGASYSDKRKTINNINSDLYSLETVADGDTELFFASDASFLFDYSEDEFVVNKNFNSLTTNGSIASGGLVSAINGLSTEANVVSLGYHLGTELRAGDDIGGSTGTTSLTNATALPVAGNASVLSGGNNQAGFIKIYVGTTAVYIPYWDTIT